MEDQLLGKCQAAYELLSSPEDISRFLKLNSSSTRLLSKYLHTIAKDHGTKKKIECQLSHLKSLSIKAKHRLGGSKTRKTHTGGGAVRKENRSSRVQWVDLKSAFKSRIRTGAVVNISHKFVDPFMEDACILLKRRLQNFLKKRINLKVNLELSCKYELVRTGEIEDKYFNTPNFLLTPTTDLDTVIKQWKERLQVKVC